MQISNVHTVNGEGTCTIQVQGSRISSITEGPLPTAQGPVLQFTDALAFPGLINSHDHLDFNLFPPLGNRIYNNYAEWGRDIHEQNKTAIKIVLQVPQRLRAQWGLYKNLCNGVTTVVNHGKKLRFGIQPPIGVLQQVHNLHSVAFENNWRNKLQSPFRWRKPFVIHIGEGTDALCKKEIDTFLAANRSKRKLIGVHGVAMDAQQAAGFAALVWCPATNLFLLGQTAAVNELRHHTAILFGTDSTLTASWNIWQQLRQARQLQLLSDADLFAAVTNRAADVWDLPLTGKLAPDYQANMVVAKAKGLRGLDAFYATDPADILLVLHRGNISQFDESLYHDLQQQGVAVDGFEKLVIGRSVKYVKGRPRQLMQRIAKYFPAVQFFSDNFNAIWAHEMD